MERGEENRLTAQSNDEIAEPACGPYPTQLFSNGDQPSIGLRAKKTSKAISGDGELREALAAHGNGLRAVNRKMLEMSGYPVERPIRSTNDIGTRAVHAGRVG